jgi:hypothetical protein
VVLSEVILGVASNVAFQMIGEGYQKSVSYLEKNKEIGKFIKSLKIILPKRYQDEIGNIEAFICSPESENVIRQIFSTQVDFKKKSQYTLESINQEYKQLFFLYSQYPREESDKIAEILFSNMFEICMRLFDGDVRRGLLSSHDKLESIRYNFIKDSINNLEKNVKFLMEKDRPTIQQYLEFEKKYREQCVDRFKYIRPPHFEHAEKILIDTLYVSPNFKNGTEKSQEILDIHNFIVSINRTVVLGDPGAGKTTFSQRICYDFSQGLGKSKYSKQDVTPLLVTLRDYGVKLSEDGCSIVQYIENISTSWYQLPPPNGVFEYLLMNGRALVIFDGLDELLDTSKRQTISDNIESFSNQYPSVPIIITSRKVGYEQAPLNRDKFSIYYISDFDDNQVKEYVGNYFTYYSIVNSEERNNVISSFLTDSLNVKDLRSNPLILSLMCDLYRGEGYIPKNRPDVYEKCSELLLKKWDKIRGVHDGIILDTHLKRTLGNLAFQIYSDEKLQAGVPEKKLKRMTVEILFPKWYDDEDEAISQADRFINFCKGRAWVFSEVGSPGDGDDLYQFTHRTFLEYFTAYHIVRSYQTPTDLFLFLKPKIINREWDVIAQLALQMKNSNLEDAGNEILNQIIDESEEKESKIRFNLLSFCVRSLEFIVPTPNVIQNIVNHAFDFAIDINLESRHDLMYLDENITIDELINPLFVADKENIAFIRKSIIQITEKNIKIDDRRASSIIKIISALPSFNNFFKIKGKEHLSSKINLPRLQQEIVHNNKKRILELCKSNRYNAIDGFFFQILSEDDLIKIYGPGILFSVNAVYGTSPTLVSSVIDCIFSDFNEMLKDDSNNRDRIFKEILKISDQILKSPVPWKYATCSIQYIAISPQFKGLMMNLHGDQLNSNTLFGLFTLTAPLIEYDITFNSSDDLAEDIFKQIESIDSAVLDPLLFIYRAKLRGFYQTEIVELLEESGFSEKQKNIITDWISSKRKFLELDQTLKFDSLKPDLTGYNSIIISSR